MTYLESHHPLWDSKTGGENSPSSLLHLKDGFIFMFKSLIVTELISVCKVRHWIHIFSTDLKPAGVLQEGEWFLNLAAGGCQAAERWALGSFWMVSLVIWQKKKHVRIELKTVHQLAAWESGKSMSFQVGKHHFPFPIKYLWESHSIARCLSFLLCTMGLIMASMFYCIVKPNCINTGESVLCTHRSIDTLVILTFTSWYSIAS